MTLSDLERLDPRGQFFGASPYVGLLPLTDGDYIRRVNPCMRGACF